MIMCRLHPWLAIHLQDEAVKLKCHEMFVEGEKKDYVKV